MHGQSGIFVEYVVAVVVVVVVVVAVVAVVVNADARSLQLIV